MHRKYFSAFPLFSHPPLWDGKDPIREELFSAERLGEHARSLASAQHVAPLTTKGFSLARRLKDNSDVLLSVYQSTVTAIGEGRAITPAAEWLIDNYHLVERNIREIHSDLPAGILPAAPKADGRAFCGLSAHIRPCLGLRGPYGQPLRS